MYQNKPAKAIPYPRIWMKVTGECRKMVDKAIKPLVKIVKILPVGLDEKGSDFGD